MRVLLTNDDGITAPGLQAARRALREIEGVEVDVIAPDSNRSATARSITTRSPLTVEEVEFGDGDKGYATDGTPVDCVRFAELGLVGHRPDLIFSGINHGANLGDDITYSGTVAAAFEGIVLGIPAVALFAAVLGWRHGLCQRSLRVRRGGRIRRRDGATADRRASAGGDPDQRELPGRRTEGNRSDQLGKRIYNDELKLIGEADGRRHYEIYGWQPGYEEIEGTDLNAVAQGRISVTPIHFDLTDHGGLDRLRGWGFEEMLAASAPTSV